MTSQKRGPSRSFYLKRQRSNAEDMLQISIVEFHDWATKPEDALLFAVPNGGKRDAGTAAVLKRMGVRAGVSDLILVVQGRVLFIELKLDDTLLTTRTEQRESQRLFQQQLETLGHIYLVARSLDDYVAILRTLKIPMRFQPLPSRPLRRPAAGSPAPSTAPCTRCEPGSCSCDGRKKPARRRSTRSRSGGP